MSHAALIIGESGTGKTTSIRHLDPEKTLLIQCVRKPLPFKSQAWKPITKEGGSVFVSDQSAEIIAAMHRAPQIGKEIVIVDDWQYMMCNEYMRRAGEKGFQKFSDIAEHAWLVLSASIECHPSVRIYILSHTTSDDGPTRVKTIGKLLDEKITIEGMFSIVLKSVVRDGEYMFATQNSGNDTVKSPMGMFDERYIPNDLAEIDRAIFDYYEIGELVT